MIDRSTAPLEMFGEPDDTECPHGIPTGMGVECWECRYDQLKIDYDALERERDELQEELHQKLMYSGGEISRLEADNGLLMKRLENFKKLWEWMRFTDKYHFCEDNGIRIEDMELKEG